MNEKLSSNKNYNEDARESTCSTWKNYLNDIDINTAQDNRTCEFLLMEESVICCNDVIRKFKSEASNFSSERTVMSISCEDIQKFLIQFPEDEFTTFQYRLLFKCACEEAKQFIDNNMLFLPTEMLAQLIKLTAIFYMFRDVQQCIEEIRNEFEKKNLSKESLIVTSPMVNTSPSCEFLKKVANKPRESLNITIEEKHVYFILNGFYNAELIKELRNLNAPLSCIIEVADTENGMYMAECKCKESNDSFELNIRIHEFWTEIYELFEGNVQYDYLENIYHAQFTRTEFPLLSYEDECEEIYSDICKFIDLILNLKIQHTNYIRNMLLIDLGDFRRITVSKMTVYQDELNTLPPDSVTIATIMNALLNEVAHNNDVNPNFHNKNEDNEEEIFEIKTVVPLNNKPSFVQSNCCEYKNRIAALFNNAKRRHFGEIKAEVNKDNSRIIQYDIDKKPFVVNDSNKLKLKFRPYKQIRDFLRDLNVKYMKLLHPFCLYRQKGIRRSKLEELIRKYGTMLPNILDLNDDEYNDSINLYFLNEMNCKCTKNLTLPMMSQIQNLFPNRRKYFELNHIFDNRPCDKLKNFKWKEILPPEIFVQKVLNDNDKFSCLDYYYCSHSNTFLLKFHNDLDEFGCKIETWHQNLKTPICLRDFFKYVIHDEANWIENELQKRKNEEILLENLIENRPNPSNIIKSDFFQKYDYVLKGSIKDELRKADAAEEEPVNIKGKGAVKSKGVSATQIKKTQMKTDPFKVTDPLTSYDNLIAFFQESLAKKEHECMKKGNSYNFIGYDISNKRIQLTGATTTFQSLDGIRAIVDTTNFLGCSSKISVSLTGNGHGLTYHYNFGKEDVCMFHLTLENGTFVALSKPEELRQTETLSKPEDPKETCVEENESSKQQDFQYVYYVTERRKSKLNCFNVEYTSKKTYLLTESEWNKFKDTSKYLGTKSQIKNHDKQSLSQLIAPQLEGEKSKLRCSKNELVTMSCVENYVISNENLNEESEENSFIRKTESKLKLDFIEDLKEIKNNAIPVFKVCSTKLHANAYLKRIKSYVTIPIDGMLKRIQYKPKIKTGKRIIEVQKCFRLENNNKVASTELPYNINISLPSALHLTTENIAEEPYYIRQQYLQKGPQCQNVADEQYRLFFTNGCIIIKKLNGELLIYVSDGNIIKFNCPFRRNVKKNKRTTHEIKNNDNFSKSYKKAMRHVLRRRLKHMMDGPEARYKTSKKCYKKTLKNYFQINRNYYLDTFGKYVIIKNDGKMIKYLNGKIMEKQKYYVSKDTNYELFETLYEREDSTRILWRKYGDKTVQFPDGTRITTSISTKCVELFPEDDLYEASNNDDDEEDEDKVHRVCLNPSQLEQIIPSESCECDPSPSIVTEFIDENSDWILVNIIYEFQHPNYVTTICGTDKDLLTLSLPGNVTIEKVNITELTCTIGENIRVGATNETITMDSVMCMNCKKGASATINIAPLYSNDKITKETPLLSVTDSFNKKFEMNYGGIYKRNDNFLRGTNNNQYCADHVTIDKQRMYVMNSDCSGLLYWNVKMYEDKLKNNQKCLIDKFEAQEERSEIIEWKLLRNCFSHEKYLMPYAFPKINLTKKLPKLDLYTTYIIKIILYSLVDCKKLEHMHNILKKLNNLNEMDDINIMMKNIIEDYFIIVNRDSINSIDNQSGGSNKEIVEIHKENYYDKWNEKKRQVCEISDFIKFGNLPKYFNSIYAKDFLKLQTPSIDVISEPQPIRLEIVKVDVATSTADIQFELRSKEDSNVNVQNDLGENLTVDLNDEKSKQEENQTYEKATNATLIFENQDYEQNLDTLYSYYSKTYVDKYDHCDDLKTDINENFNTCHDMHFKAEQNEIIQRLLTQEDSSIDYIKCDETIYPNDENLYSKFDTLIKEVSNISMINNFSEKSLAERVSCTTPYSATDDIETVFETPKIVGKQHIMAKTILKKDDHRSLKKQPRKLSEICSNEEIIHVVSLGTQAGEYSDENL